MYRYYMIFSYRVPLKPTYTVISLGLCTDSAIDDDKFALPIKMIDVHVGSMETGVQ